ncbi:MAG TPA: hypothetical protein VFW62_10370 [bacterium]|nr:hypothetical protein [bacterium]
MTVKQGFKQWVGGRRAEALGKPNFPQKARSSGNTYLKEAKERNNRRKHLIGFEKYLQLGRPLGGAMVAVAIPAVAIPAVAARGQLERKHWNRTRKSNVTGSFSRRRQTRGKF